MRTILILAAMAISLANGQPTTFEVASIKPSEPGNPERSMQNAANTLTLKNTPLRDCILFAWHLQEYQLSGGGWWVTNEGYEIVGKTDDSLAKLPSAARLEQMKIMLQNLLKDRFQLVLREETKTVNAYALTVAKGGFKLKPTEESVGGSGAAVGMLQITKAPIAMLVELLSGRLDRPVVDRTGITGSYSGKLTWTPDSAVSAAPGGADSQNGPSLFAALQEQLGLKLEATKAPVTTYVIERAEKPNSN